MKKAFIYVGHSNWGKSWALREMTDGNSYKKKIQLNGEWVWVRKMSNDDQPEGLLQFVQSIPSNWYQNYILAYCPNHENDNVSRQIIQSLQNHCELYFFVQRQKFSNNSLAVTDQEIQWLKSCGEVEILEAHHDFKERAVRFTSFITNRL